MGNPHRHEVTKTMRLIWAWERSRGLRAQQGENALIGSWGDVWKAKMLSYPLRLQRGIFVNTFHAGKTTVLRGQVKSFSWISGFGLLLTQNNARAKVRHLGQPALGLYSMNSAMIVTFTKVVDSWHYVFTWAPPLLKMRIKVDYKPILLFFEIILI